MRFEQPMYYYSVIALLSCLVLGCSSDAHHDSIEDQTGQVTIKLVPKPTSAFLKTSSQFTSAGDCTLTSVTGDEPVSGKCLTPINVGGSFSVARLSSSLGGPPARILGGGTEIGLNDIFKRGFFDLLKPFTIDSSEDNLESVSGQSFNLFWVESQVVETTFLAASKVFHVRTYFVDQPPASDVYFDSCHFSVDEQSEMNSKGTIYTDSRQGIRAKDILVCIKDHLSDTCAETDYQWVDSSGVLQSTRPAASEPKQIVTHQRYYTTSVCIPNVDFTPKSMSWGHGDIAFSLSTPVTIEAAYADRGEKTYTYAGKSGTKIHFEVVTDTDGALFIAGSTGLSGGDPATWQQSDVLQNIDRIQFKPLGWASGLSNPTASGPLGGAVSATLNIAVE